MPGCSIGGRHDAGYRPGLPRDAPRRSEAPMSDNASDTVTRRPLVIYLQYTNPAAYPPLEQSSLILARNGWDVIFLAAAADGAATLTFPPHPAIRIWRLPGFGGGLPQRLNYAAYLLWSLIVCLRFRPDWIYASDPLSAPAAVLVQKIVGCKTIYHEHDSPTYARTLSRVQRLVRDARSKMGRDADLCILPQEKRLAAFVEQTGRTGPVECVWNCPRREEVAAPREAAIDRPMTFYYHGSLNPERFPMSIADALQQASRSGGRPELVIIGYETLGSVGYMARFIARISELGISGQVNYIGPLPRCEIAAIGAQANVGFAFMPLATSDHNMAAMTGASCKPFDYMAMGQMLLVSILPDWRAMFVTPGYALACDPYDPDSLGKAMVWCTQNPDAVRAMGEKGRQRIANDWNYERCFAPVAARMAEAVPHATDVAATGTDR
jgi:glycosyltransferase involved in cell wall biosynthesis